MPQDEQLTDTLQKVADIAQELGRIDAIVRQFTAQVKGIEDRLTKLDENINNYSKQLGRLESEIGRVEAIGKQRDDLAAGIKELDNALHDFYSSTFEKTIAENTAQTKELLNKARPPKKRK